MSAKIEPVEPDSTETAPSVSTAASRISAVADVNTTLVAILMLIAMTVDAPLKAEPPLANALPVFCADSSETFVAETTTSPITVISTKLTWAMVSPRTSFIDTIAPAEDASDGPTFRLMNSGTKSRMLPPGSFFHRPPAKVVVPRSVSVTRSTLAPLLPA